MKKEVKKLFKNLFETIKEYYKNNSLFVIFVLLELFNTILLRGLTTKHIFTLYPILVDLSLIILIGSLNYLFKSEKRRKKYLIILSFFLGIVCIINALYYTFYASFSSLSEVNSLTQAKTVANSVTNKLSIFHFIYIISPIVFTILSKKRKHIFLELKTKEYKNKILKHVIVSVLLLLICFITSSNYSHKKLYSFVNRSYIVNKYGIILYQTIDVTKYLTMDFNTMFNISDALNETIEFYNNNNEYKEKNKYSDMFDGYNLIFVHMESVESFLLDLSYNNKLVLPNVNKLMNEGMYFSNFFPQVSVGTSSDTEFTLLTSLLPSSTGTVFQDYYDRNYVTIPKLLNDKNYYTFSMHGNNFTMWNRNLAHPSLGYKNYYFKDKYTYTEKDTINLGISDELFFKQSIDYLENIEKENPNYFGTVITLSNHSPFTFTDKYLEYDLTTRVKSYNQRIKKYTYTDYDYLTGTTIGNYIISSHSADNALGNFINYINNSNYFNNTIFVFYGDHDARLSIDQYNYFYNYDPIKGELKDKDDPDYYEYSTYENILMKKTPLIIWSKNDKIRDLIKGTYDYPMGMIDVMPTIGNMIGIENKYQLGHDIFNIKDDNIIVFPNGNFITKDFLYNSSLDEIYTLNTNVKIDNNYINYVKDYALKQINISNNIILYDLISKLDNNKNE